MKDIVRKAVEYFLIIVSIMECNSVYSRTVDYNFHVDILSTISIVVFITYIVINIKKIQKKTALLVLIIFLYLGVFAILNVHNNYINYFYIISLLPASIIYFKDYETIKTFLKKFTNCVAILALLSIIFYIGGSVLNIIPSSSILIRWGGIRLKTNYLFIHFDTQMQNIFGLTLKRNTGIFTEAPMYSYILVLGIMSELVLDNPSKNKILLLLIATVMTFSATGIICSSILLFLAFSFRKNGPRKTTKVLLIPIILMFGIISIGYVYDNKINNEYASYSVRLDDYKAAFSAWRDSYIIGNGFYNTQATVRYMNKNNRNITNGQSSAIMRILSEGGVYLIILYSAPILYQMTKGLAEKKYNSFTFSLTLLILLFVTNTPYNLVTIIFLGLTIQLDKIQNDSKMPIADIDAIIKS